MKTKTLTTHSLAYESYEQNYGLVSQNFHYKRGGYR